MSDRRSTVVPTETEATERDWAYAGGAAGRRSAAAIGKADAPAKPIRVGNERRRDGFRKTMEGRLAAWGPGNRKR